MNAAILHSHNHKSPISLFCNHQIRVGSPICTFNDGRAAFPLRKNVLCLGVLSTNSDAGRPLQPGRTEMENDGKISELPDDKLHGLAKREKMIALLRRIQSSISKAEATHVKQNKPDLSDKAPEGSAPMVRPPSQKSAKANVSRGRKGHQVSASKRSIPQKNDRTQKKPQQSEAIFTVARQPMSSMKKSPIPRPSIPRGKAVEKKEFSATLNLSNPRAKLNERNGSSAAARPPSSFMKKSPIPTLSIPRGIPMVKNDDFSETTAQGQVPMKDLKLPQLKEMAKSKGIKGYSKLKKSQLLELLSS